MSKKLDLREAVINAINVLAFLIFASLIVSSFWLAG